MTTFTCTWRCGEGVCQHLADASAFCPMHKVASRWYSLWSIPMRGERARWFATFVSALVAIQFVACVLAVWTWFGAPEGDKGNDARLLRPVLLLGTAGLALGAAITCSAIYERATGRHFTSVLFGWIFAVVGVGILLSPVGSKSLGYAGGGIGMALIALGARLERRRGVVGTVLAIAGLVVIASVGLMEAASGVVTMLSELADPVGGPSPGSSSLSRVTTGLPLIGVGVDGVVALCLTGKSLTLVRAMELSRQSGRRRSRPKHLAYSVALAVVTVLPLLGQAEILRMTFVFLSLGVDLNSLPLGSLVYDGLVVLIQIHWQRLVETQSAPRTVPRG